jgi:hypothetical protein
LGELALVDADFSEFNFGVEVFGVDFEDFVEDDLLFLEVLLVLVESQKNVENFEITGFFKEL